MAAWRWQIALLAVLAVGAAALALARLAGAGPAAALALAAAVVAVQPVLVSAATYLGAARARARDDPAPRGAVGAMLREGFALAESALHMALEPWLRAEGVAAGAGESAPVLLVHGLGCNRALWWRLRRRLAAAGLGPVLAVNLEPPLAPIGSHVGAIDRALQALELCAPGRPVTIVAHSMGGLVARAALAEGRAGSQATRVHALVTLATPHHGSVLAHWLPAAPPLAQLRPGSPFLGALAHSPVPAGLPIVSIYSAHDNLVGPPESSRLAGARNIALAGLGHFALLGSPAVARCVIDAILDPAGRA